jgi:hypothetical protein
MLALDVGEHQFGVETVDAGMPRQDGDIFVNIILLIRTRHGRSRRALAMSREVSIHLSTVR